MDKNKEITIFRLEHKQDQKGPYSSYKISRKEWTNRYHGDRETPSPCDDELLYKYGEKNGWFDGSVNIKNLFFAFESIESLYEWFTDKELSILKQHNFVVAKYKVTQIIQGSNQVVFTKEDVISRSTVKSLPKRIKTHPQEHFVEKEQQYTEEESQAILELAGLL